MNTATHGHRGGEFGHGKKSVSDSATLRNYELLGYLMSIGDVVAALGIMITICGVSLLTLYTALGAL